MGTRGAYAACYEASFGAAACYYRLFLFTTVFFFNAAHAVPCLEKISSLPTCQQRVSLRKTLLYFILAATVVSFFFFCKHACLPFVLTLDKCCDTHYITLKKKKEYRLFPKGYFSLFIYLFHR